MSRSRPFVLAALLAAASGAMAPAAADEPPAGPRILSAYFGLDEAALPLTHPFRLSCGDGDSIDSLPIVLSREIDQRTLEPSDFVIRTRSGRSLQPNCATLNPAGEESEDRTILLLGELGDWPADPPLEVEIVGEVLTEPAEDGSVVSLLGLVSPEPPPYPEGPTLVFAEPVAEADWELSESEGGPDCPAGPTRSILRIVWSGGVTRRADPPAAFPPGAGEEPGPDEYAHITVELETTDGETIRVHPFYIGDRGDGDNNNELCLKEAGRPLSVGVTAQTVTDPANDWNPDTQIMVGE